VGTRTARTVLRASGPVSFEEPAVGGEGVHDAFELAHAQGQIADGVAGL
jgi:hypothetical protein